MDNPLAEDLDHILAAGAPVWHALMGKRLLITGGTGFFGSWLLEAIAWANAKAAIGLEAVVLSRDPESFLAGRPHLAVAKAIRFHRGDILADTFPKGSFDGIIHAATPWATRVKDMDPELIYRTVATGTQRVLDFAVSRGIGDVLFASSGKVYGPQSPDMAFVPENHSGGPDTMMPSSAYGEGKRAAELLCACYHRRHGIGCKIARCFAFIGPFLPLDIHYAAGNFLRDGLAGGPVDVHGDGTAQRSYLYMADLVVWLMTILVRGQACRPYNVGSEEAVTIAELAGKVASCFDPRPAVRILATGGPSDRYVPSTLRARSELGLCQTIGLDQAIERTLGWLQRQGADQRLAPPPFNAGKAKGVPDAH